MNGAVNSQLGPSTRGGVRAGLGDVVPFQFDPTRLLTLQKMLDAAVVGTSDSLKACPNAPAGLKTGWDTFAKAEGQWSLGVQAQIPLLLTIVGTIPLVWAYRMNSLYQEGLAMQAQIKTWQQRIVAAGCQLQIPQLPDPPNPIDEEKKREDLLSTIKYGAIAVAAVAVAIVAAPVVTEAIATARTLRKTALPEKSAENPLSPGAKTALIIGGTAAVAAGAGGVGYWLATRKTWKRLGQSDVVPVGAEFAMAIVGAPDIVTLYESTILRATARDLTFSPPGGARPSDWPSDDSLGVGAYRVVGTAVQAVTPPLGVSAYAVWTKS